MTDHHSQYLAKALAALEPEGRARVDDLLEGLAQAAGGREWLIRFAQARKDEADLGSTGASSDPDPGLMLSAAEHEALRAGFATIRDAEPRDDVSDWANAVLALLQDEPARPD